VISNKYNESRMVNDLNVQIVLQQRMIAELRHKVVIIRDVSNDSKYFDKRLYKVSTHNEAGENTKVQYRYFQSR